MYKHLYIYTHKKVCTIHETERERRRPTQSTTCISLYYVESHRKKIYPQQYDGVVKKIKYIFTEVDLSCMYIFYNVYYTERDRGDIGYGTKAILNLL